MASRAGQHTTIVSTPWMRQMRWNRARDCSQLVDEELLAFEQYVGPSTLEISLRWRVFDLLKDLLRRVFSGIIVEAYGSLTSGLFLPTADIDVVVRYPDVNGIERTPHQLLPVLFDLLMRTAFMAKGKPILDTPVPVSRLTTLPKFGSFKIDITMEFDYGIAGTDALENLFDEYWAWTGNREGRARRLIFFVKYLLQRYKCYGASSQGLTGLAVTSMVIAYFKIETMKQVEPIPVWKDLVNFLIYYGFELRTDKYAVSTRGLPRTRSNAWSHVIP